MKYEIYDESSGRVVSTVTITQRGDIIDSEPESTSRDFIGENLTRFEHSTYLGVRPVE